MSDRPPLQNSGFGKRGRVTVKPSGYEPPPSEPENDPAPVAKDLLKWAAGGIAATLLFMMVMAGTGGTGGGLLGGILGGLLGHHLANKARAPSTTAAAPNASPAPAAASTSSVQRGGFGSTASTGGFFSGS